MRVMVLLHVLRFPHRPTAEWAGDRWTWVNTSSFSKTSAPIQLPELETVGCKEYLIDTPAAFSPPRLARFVRLEAYNDWKISINDITGPLSLCLCLPLCCACMARSALRPPSAPTLTQLEHFRTIVAHSRAPRRFRAHRLLSSLGLHRHV